ncbi:acetylxylan esterase [Fusarium subglutinans]|uniref:Acetylxylan esterase n=1 Tax=Gibberella subglutinans TaxID=42677 RepID=A0A8H5KUI3_GIBSU|nr:acetylxylan esterase [Fusarium subglutinans]KAF5578906.1 acetylxylan esterase [Fusarium subglutinans]
MLLRSSLSRSCHIFRAGQCPSRHHTIIGQAPAIHNSTRATSPDVTLRLMPLGGSVTYGVGSSDGNGYRKVLRDLLLANGYQVCMVGSRRAGSMHNNEHEGWRGYRLDQIESRARRSLATVNPNLFTINAGSNDCIQSHELGAFRERMDNLLEYLWKASPLSTVILSTLLLNADEQVNSRVLNINNHLRDLVMLKEAERKRIVLADMYSNKGPKLDDLMDGTHPNDDGYSKMAYVWFDAIQKTRASGFFFR